MKIKELIIVSIVSVSLTYVAFLLGLKGSDDAAGLPQAMGIIGATIVAAGLYSAREQQKAPPSVKLTVAGTLATVAVCQGLLFQKLFKWMEFPDVSIAFGVLGSFLMPFVLWGLVSKKPNSVREK